jgi:hypothetical protein
MALTKTMAKHSIRVKISRFTMKKYVLLKCLQVLRMEIDYPSDNV